MKVVRVDRAGGNLELAETRVPEPGRGSVRIKIQACGVCHSDSFTKEGAFPGIIYPRVPGHEIAGVIDALGADTEPWKIGERVGVGWHGGHDGTCDSCRRGDFVACAQLQIPGLSYDGGYAEFVCAPIGALARIPAELTPEAAAPIMCAGVTTFNALRASGARPGDLVAVQGIGGLGHLGVQFANKFGFETIAIGRGAEKKRARAEARSKNLHRRRITGGCKGTTRYGRRQGDSRNRPGRQGDGPLDRWARGGWQVARRRRQRRAIPGRVGAAHNEAQIDRGLAIGNFPGLRRRAQIRRRQWRTRHDRNLPVGASCRGLRAYDVGQGAFSMGAEDLKQAVSTGSTNLLGGVCPSIQTQSR